MAILIYDFSNEFDVTTNINEEYKTQKDAHEAMENLKKLNNSNVCYYNFNIVTIEQLSR